MVEDVIINRPVSFLMNWPTCYDFSCICRLLQRHFGWPEISGGLTFEQAEQLGKDMFLLNCYSVDARYGAGEAAKFRNLDYRFNQEVWLKDLVVYKSLCLWEYQSCEGTVPDDEVFKILTNYMHTFAHQIVGNLEDYKAVKVY